MKKFCDSLTRYERRDSSVVNFGSVRIGGNNPIAVQSMANCSTMDTKQCVVQIEAIHTAGGRIMRFTAPSMREGENLRCVADEARKAGFGDVALVADIHFTPDVALVAAEYFDKVRINPGNYKNTNGQLRQLIAKCKERGVALRIGVNHGSLAAHIMDKYGDTPEGMVESAMEFLRECRHEEFDNVVVSIKSSNVRVMVGAYRLLTAVMREAGMCYPLHLGVTEAGNALAARVKSAVGIGTLLADGIGDTIRVSLTEPPQNEIPVGQALADYFSNRVGDDEPINDLIDDSLYSPYEYKRRKSIEVKGVGGECVPLLFEELTDEQRESVELGEIALIEATATNCVAQWRAEILNLSVKGDFRPVILRKRYSETDFEQLVLKASADFGALFIDGLADGLHIVNKLSDGKEPFGDDKLRELGLAIFQASRVRISTTEYIACPGCGRTLYDLQSTLAQIKERTSHLRGLKIGVMGCIVNGPGEMADADYGYVGSGRGQVTLYKGREVVRRSVSEHEAIDALIDVIKENNDWRDSE